MADILFGAAGWIFGAGFLAAAVASTLAWRRLGQWLGAQRHAEELLLALGAAETGVERLQRTAVETAHFRGWREREAPAEARLALIMRDVAHAVAEHRKGHAPAFVYVEPDGTPAGVPIGLGGAMVRILDFCRAEGIDLEAALLASMAYDVARTPRHGVLVA